MAERLKRAKWVLKRKKKMTTAAARKGETIRKIEFGGLVIKGGLSAESKAVILGAIADAARRLADPAKRDRAVIYYKQLGDEVFIGIRE